MLVLRILATRMWSLNIVVVKYKQNRILLYNCLVSRQYEILLLSYFNKNIILWSCTTRSELFEKNWGDSSQFCGTIATLRFRLQITQPMGFQSQSGFIINCSLLPFAHYDPRSHLCCSQARLDLKPPPCYARTIPLSHAGPQWTTKDTG